MLGKIMIGAGVALCLVGGVIMAALATGTQMARGGYARSVQHYAEQSASAGSPLALVVLGMGAALLLAGMVLTLLHRIHH